MPTIAIVGFGASGMLLATQLLSQATQRLRIVAFDRNMEAGVGTAYGTVYKEHLLNVPAARMSALPTEPTHFLDWLRGNAPELQPIEGTFAPRMTYGNYLHHTFNKACEQAPPESFELVKEAVVAVVKRDAGYEVRTNTQNSILADIVVLALGNYVPANPRLPDPAPFTSANYMQNPWAKGALASIGLKEDIALIGTGLTALDIVLSLKAHKHTGRIFALSRHGAWPTVHGPSPIHPDIIAPLGAKPSLAAVFAAVKTALRTTTDQEAWRGILDSIRPYTQRLWAGFSQEERERFYRHLNHRWTVGRHRMPQSGAATLSEMQQSGQLKTIPGRIQRIEEHEGSFAVVVAHKGQTQAVIADRIINCTGPQSNFANSTEPLVQSLRVQGLLVPDALRTGILTTLNGKLVDEDGMANNRLYTIGPPMKSTLLECTAMPEIRVQAMELAALLLKTIASEFPTT